MAIKVSDSDRNKKDTVKVKTRKTDVKPESRKWYVAKSKDERGKQLLETALFLKEQQQYRFRQASTHSRLYSNLPLANFAGTSMKMGASGTQMPADRPTMNVIQSCVDTLVARLSQSKPRPVFLTDNGDYKERKLAKQLNTFIAGELYRTKAYELAELVLRDSSVIGSGAIKVYVKDDLVELERTLVTELYVDNNDAFYGRPRSLYQMKLIDRNVLADMFPEAQSKISQAEQAYPDNAGDSQRTSADQVIVVEGWHLPSGKNATDGRHTIACSSGVLVDEEYTKKDFPFVFLHYSPRMVGLWGQGLAEQLIGTQVEINKLLVTISQSINLVGVPRIFVEDGSKVVKAHLNNAVGSIVTYRGTKPQYEVAPCVPQEMYAQLQRLIEYAYQQSGISALAATSQKPAGLNSGAAMREYDDLQSDRFSVLNKRYDRMFIELVYKIIDEAVSVCKETGKYNTVYPDKDGTREIDLPHAKLEGREYVIQCYDSSSLPKEPAGRLAKVTEMMQAGIIDAQEGRRLLDFPDLSQVDKLAMAAQERIYKQLDAIVEESSYQPPDPFTDIMQGKKIISQYYNLYDAANLEESKLEMLRMWQSQLLALEQAAMTPAQPIMQQAPTQAAPEAQPTSSLLPQV